MIVKLTDVDGSALPVESSAFVAAQASHDAGDTSVILLSTSDKIQVKESTEEIWQILSSIPSQDVK